MVFLLHPHPAQWQGGLRGELRLIGSFGLEKWISPCKKKEKKKKKKETCFLPNKMTNELSICCLQSEVHNAPSACMMDFIMAGVSKVYCCRLPLTGSSPGCSTPTTVLQVQPCF